MILPPSYWEPIAPDRPCGDDLSYDAAFLDLQVKLRGKEETQFSAAEDPNWREILEAASALANQFKHVQLGVILTLALLQLHGLAGFREGLQLLRHWLEKYWSNLYPQLDPEDNLDPTERVNILQTLAVTAPGDPYRFGDRLAHVPLGRSQTLGALSLHQIKHGSPAATGGSVTALDPAQVAATFRDSPPDYLQERFAAVTESLAILKEMEGLLTKLLGGSQGPNFTALKKVLEEMLGFIAPYVQTAPVPVTATTAASPSPSSTLPLNAAIASREEVLRALRAICDYYQRCEPSSPVPFLLQRAQRLVTMDFLQIMGDLVPEALPQLKTITGGPEIKEQKT